MKALLRKAADTRHGRMTAHWLVDNFIRHTELGVACNLRLDRVPAARHANRFTVVANNLIDPQGADV